MHNSFGSRSGQNAVYRGARRRLADILFRNGTLNFYSKDHSLARAAVERGEITAAEIRGHEDQNKLTRVLGSDAFAAPDYKICTDYTEGDAILICTDGFWEYVYEYEMERVLRSTDGANPALKKWKNFCLPARPRETTITRLLFCGLPNLAAQRPRKTRRIPQKQNAQHGKGGSQCLNTDRNTTYASTVSER